MAETSAATAPAPAAAPSAPGGSPPAPAQRQSSSSGPANNMADAFDQLEAMGREPEPESKPKDEPAPRQQQQTQKPPDVQKPAEQKAAPKPGEDSLPDPEQAPKMRAGELSRHYKALYREHAALKQKMAEAANKPVDNELLTRAQKEAADVRAMHEKAQEELRFARYEKSQEYQDKYWKPYEKAYQDGVKKTAGLTVIPRTDPDTNEVVQAARPATQADFDAIFGQIDDNKAAEMAEQLFGVKAPMVLLAREKTLEANSARMAALEEYRTKGGEMEKTRQLSEKQLHADLEKTFSDEARSASEKHAIWFKPQDGDEKGNEILEKGMSLAQQAFSGFKMAEDGQRIPLSPKERAKLHGAMFLKAGSFDRLVYRNRNLISKVAALEAKLKGYAGSEPEGGEGRKLKKEATGSAMDQALATLMDR